MKFCNSCETEKTDSKFHKREASIDGLSAKCKICQRVYDKARACDPARAEARAIYQQTEEGKKATQEAKNAYRKRNPEKTKAHAKVAREIRAGNLTRKPCERCGSEERIHAHHEDYSRSLDINWLCDDHHKQRHKEINNG